MFNFEAEASHVNEKNLFLLILGGSGAGKSHLIGSVPGKTLYLHCSNESHGVSSAKKSNGAIVSVCIDRDAKGGALKADDSWKRLFAALDADSIRAANFENIALDGLTELEKVIRGLTVWKESCKTAQGKHNQYAEPQATIDQFDILLARLRQLQDVLGVRILTTGIIDVTATEDNGAILEAKPRLSGYTVAESVCQTFNDIVMIGRMKGKTGSGPVLQMAAEIGRESKGADGAVKKTFGFTPRLQGVNKVPEYIKADLKEVLKLKEQG
jgi:hypothetical protein